MPAKRKAKTDAQGGGPVKQAKHDGQKDVSRNIDVPIDEGFRSQSDVKVYIDGQSVIYDASLNQTNIGNNNNKFYRLQLLAGAGDDQYFTHTRWGRVGAFGQHKTTGPSDLEAALKEFGKKFKDKSGHSWEERNASPKKGKYTFLERNYEDDDAEDQVKKQEDDDEEEEHVRGPAKSNLPIPTQRLMELIFNQNHFNAVLESIGYNANKLPLGKLGKSTLKKGFEHLQELANLIKNPNLAQSKYHVSQQDAVEDFSNKYYSTIPHEFGRRRPPLIDNNDILRAEVAMLDTLTDMEVANAIMKTTREDLQDAESVNILDKRFNELGMKEMTPLKHNSEEYRALSEYLVKSSGHTHKVQYRLEDIFRIERSNENERFQKSEFARLKDSSNRRLLWHGSRTTNFGGILSQGLRIAPPEAPVNGYAFGKGIYLADMSTKSAQYCTSAMSGGTGLLLLCEAELGNPMYEIPTGDPNAAETAKKQGAIATLGVGQTCPQGWIDAGAVHKSLKGVQMPDATKGSGVNKAAPPGGYLQYNEYICYDVAQVRLRYLLRVSM